MSILVSINCITYNHENYIGDAIEGFLMQETDFEYEILIYDDASSDNTQDIIREYEKKYPNLIKPIYQTVNQGSRDDVSRNSYVFNHTRAKGKYVAMCEGDDYWTDPKKLQKQVDYMEDHPDCSMTFHAAEILDIQNNTIKIRDYNKEKVEVKDLIIEGGGLFATCSLMYKKEVLKDPPFWYFESPVGDHPLALLAGLKGEVLYMDDIMSVHLHNVEGSWHDRTCNKPLKHINHKIGKIELYRSFNDYTNNNYDKYINFKINSNLKSILFNNKLNKHPDRLKLLKLGIQRLNYLDKICAILNYYFPRLFNLIKKTNKLLKKH